jgi:hypothetical protein
MAVDPNDAVWEIGRFCHIAQSVVSHIYSERMFIEVKHKNGVDFETAILWSAYPLISNLGF